MSSPLEVPRARQPVSSGTGGRRVRVLHVIGELHDSGGAERLVAGIVTHLPRDRFEPWVCAPRGAAPTAAALLDSAGVPLVTLGRSGTLDIHRMLFGLARLIRRERFDIVHAHLFGSNLWATVLSRACGVPVIIAQEHTWAYAGNRLRVWLDGRVIGRLATRFVAVSRADAAKMVSLEKVPAEKVVVMPTAYVPHAAFSEADIRQELGIDEATPLIVTAAVMRPQKALEVLLSAHSRVLRKMPDAHLIVAGDGPCRAELVALTAQLGAEQRVHFLGRRSDVEALLQCADVAAMSSRFEGTPLFAFECMANHIPLVATAVGGLPDVVEDGRSGVLVPPGDPQALAEALVELLRDPERRRALADNAARRLSGYTIESVAERFADFYLDLLERPLSGAAARPASA